MTPQDMKTEKDDIGLLLEKSNKLSSVNVTTAYLFAIRYVKPLVVSLCSIV